VPVPGDVTRVTRPEGVRCASAGILATSSVDAERAGRAAAGGVTDGGASGTHCTGTTGGAAEGPQASVDRASAAEKRVDIGCRRSMRSDGLAAAEEEQGRLTDARGRPIPRPQLEDFADPLDYIRAFHGWKDEIARVANEAFNRALKLRCCRYWGATSGQVGAAARRTLRVMESKRRSGPGGHAPSLRLMSSPAGSYWQGQQYTWTPAACGAPLIWHPNVVGGVICPELEM
jgi:hypothetical protein